MITLGNFEKQVLLELDNELTLIEAEKVNRYWPLVRVIITSCYDSGLSLKECSYRIGNAVGLSYAP